MAAIAIGARDLTGARGLPRQHELVTSHWSEDMRAAPCCAPGRKETMISCRHGRNWVRTYDRRSTCNAMSIFMANLNLDRCC